MTILQYCMLGSAIIWFVLGSAMLILMGLRDANEFASRKYTEKRTDP